MVGQVIGNYRLVQEIGRGGMGVVYRGEHIYSGNTVAIKVIHPSYHEIPGFIERFKLEAKAMMELVHPHIVHVFDTVVLEETYYMVMEFVSGGSLMVWRKMAREMPVESPTRPSVGKVLQVMVEVCDGLGYAHRQGYIHRDIKPSNILFDREKRAKISDFGLVKIVGKEGMTLADKITSGSGSAGITTVTTASGGLTMTGAAVGTYNYMSPEQREGRKEIDYRSDIYSVGVMLYELLTGRLPVGRVKEPSAYNAGLSKEFNEIVFRALESEPGDRYSSMEGLREALAQVVVAQEEREVERKREEELRREEEMRRRQQAYELEVVQKRLPGVKMQDREAFRKQRKYIGIGMGVVGIIVLVLIVKWCFNVINTRTDVLATSPYLYRQEKNSAPNYNQNMYLNRKENENRILSMLPRDSIKIIKVRWDLSCLVLALDAYYKDHHSYPEPDYDEHRKPIIPKSLLKYYEETGKPAVPQSILEQFPIRPGDLPHDPFNNNGKGYYGYGCGNVSKPSWILTSYGPDKVDGTGDIPLDETKAWSDVVLGFQLKNSPLTFIPNKGIKGDMWRRERDSALGINEFKPVVPK
jgi:hypothetical protein